MNRLHLILTIFLLLITSTLSAQRQQIGNSNTFWEVRSDTLYITGSGDMPDFDSQEDLPWYDIRAEIDVLQIENGITRIGNYSFFNCSALTSVDLPNSITHIGNNAFGVCFGLRFITLPNSITSIGSSAFYRCSLLDSITLPNSITSIENATFLCCGSLTSIVIPNTVTSIGNNAFELCTRLASVNIPDHVTHIGNAAFSDCQGLTSISIPESVSNIGRSAFFGCYGLTSVILPAGLTSIKSSTFSNCTGLTSVTIPGSVTEIHSRAFAACYNLTNILNLNPSPVSINEDVFQSVNRSSCTLRVCRSAVEAYRAADVWKDFIILGEEGYGMSVSVNDPASGRVVGLENRFYDRDETITITAVSNPGYIFENWTSNGVFISTDNPFTFTVTSNTLLTANFREDETVNIIDTKHDEIILYPNPIQNTLFIQTSSPIQQLSVYDLNGKILKEILNPDPAVDMSYLPNGIYIVGVKTPDREVRQKIVKQ